MCLQGAVHTELLLWKHKVLRQVCLKVVDFIFIWAQHFFNGVSCARSRRRCKYNGQTHRKTMEKHSGMEKHVVWTAPDTQMQCQIKRTIVQLFKNAPRDLFSHSVTYVSHFSKQKCILCERPPRPNMPAFLRQSVLRSGYNVHPFG